MVPTGEFAAGAPGELMRLAAVGVNNGTYIYGQVVSYNAQSHSVTLRSRGGDVVCNHDTVDETAPVVAFVMSSSGLRDADVSRDQLNDLHQSVMDRVMGSNGETPTRSITRILRGILPARSHPRPTDTLLWLNAESGRGSVVSVRHAIDYAHFVDGGRRIPRSVESQLGTSFDSDPSQSLFRDAPAAGTQDEDDTNPREDEDESLESLLAEIQPREPHEPARTSPVQQAAAPPQPSRQTVDDSQLQSRVLQAISGDPALIRYFLSQCQRKRAREGDDDDVRATQRQRLDSPSDLLDLADSSDRFRQKHVFRPAREQQGMNRLIISPDHAGKNPVELMDTMISSRATRFKPYPSVFSRFYDFQFGIRGLCIMHFERFDFSARRLWYTTSNVNLTDFDPKIPLPRAREPRKLDDLSAALGVLQVFVDEFMDNHVRRFVGAAKEFVEELRGYSSWEGADIVTLAFWFDGVFEDFRRAVETDFRHGGQSRSRVREQFSFQDPHLQGVLYAIQSDRLAMLQATSGRKQHAQPVPVPAAQQSHYTKQRQVSNQARQRRLHVAFKTSNVPIPKCLRDGAKPKRTPAVDADLASGLSKLVRAKSLSLEELVALWRNESPADPRPNKALDPTWLDILLHGYSQKEAILSAAQHGVQHVLVHPRPADNVPAENHRSAQRFSQALERSLSEGQDAGTYVILDTVAALAWKRLRYSPFGIVPKKDVDPLLDGRLIHNLSFLSSSSINGCSSSEDLPYLLFEPVQRIAERIELLAIRYPYCPRKMMKGDVKGAFRHIPVASSLAKFFAGSFPGGSVIDLALPFGWTGSPAHYGVFGGAIAFLLGRESPASLEPGLESDNECFFSYVWVDDHVLVEPDVDQRLSLASQALRLSMLAVLGPNAINEKKFSGWETRLQALGLTWDTEARTVSMPRDKVDKAVARIMEALDAPFVTKIQLAKLLGSLRHVSTCVRSTRAFLQRLHVTWMHARTHSRIRLQQSTKQDLQWVVALLREGSTNAVPTSIVAGSSRPQVHLFMDASDMGLCVLYPAAREFIRVKFDDSERASIRAGDACFSINVWESLSVAFAALVWGPQWKFVAHKDHVHVRCWIDNASAVSWIDRHLTKNPAGQELIRVVSCAEVQYKVHISTAHLAGSANIMADRGSRRATKVPQDLLASIVQLQWKSLADSSRRVYLSTWRQWCEFCTQHTLNRWLPQGDPAAQSIQLTMFAVGCWRAGDAPTPLRFETIRTKLSHVAWCHQLVCGFRPVLLPEHQLAFNGMQRLSPPQRRRGAVTVAMLQIITSSLDLHIAQHRVICGAAVLGFFFCLRGSEYLSSKGRRHAYCISTSDIQVVDSTGRKTSNYSRASAVRLTIQASKTDQQGRSTTRELLKASEPPVCPVFAALLLIQNARAIDKDSPIPLCSTDRHKILSARTMTRVVRWAASRLKLDSAVFSTHSLRAGGASALHAAGASIDTIKTHGRWASDAYQRYIVQPSTRTLDLTRRMASQLDQALSSASPALHQGGRTVVPPVRAERR